MTRQTEKRITRKNDILKLYRQNREKVMNSRNLFNRPCTMVKFIVFKANPHE